MLKNDRTGLTAQRHALRHEGIFLSRIQESPAYGVVFPGHGSQYLDQLAELRWNDPTVASVFDKADQIYASRYGHPLSACIYTDHGATAASLSEPTAMQCAIFTASVAQFRRLMTFSPPPTVMIGHSLGEYAAYVASGVLSFSDGLAGVMARAEAVSELPSDRRGAMVAVRVRTESEEQTYRRLLLLASASGDIGEAITNSNTQRVVSGSEETVTAFLQAAETQRLSATRLRVTHAYHSPMLRACVAPLQARLEQLDFQTPSVTVLSSITGEALDQTDSADLAKLLAAQLIQPFDFRTLLVKAAEHGVKDFVETGPSSVLSGIIENEKNDASCIPMDSRQRPAAEDAHRVRLYLTSLGIPGPAAERRPLAAAKTAADVLTDLVSAVTGYPRYAIPGETPLNRLGFVAEMRQQLSTRLRAEYGPEFGDLSWSIDRLAAHLGGTRIHEEASSLALDDAAPHVHDVTEAEVPPHDGGAPVVTTSDRSDLLVREFVAEFATTTGYPEDVIDPNLDLEADLGIDSVKQTQVITTLATRHGITTETLDLTGASTITLLAQRLTRSSSTTTAPEPAEPTRAEQAEPETALRYIPRAIVRDLEQSPRTPRELRGMRLLLVPAADQVLTERARDLLEAAGADVWVSTALGSAAKDGVDQVSLAAELAAEHRRCGFRDGIVDLASYGPFRDALDLDAAEFSAAWRQQYAQVFSVCKEYFANLAEAADRALVAVLTNCGGGYAIKATTTGDALGCVSIGFVKSLAKELPELRLCLVDVDDSTSSAADRLVQELISGSEDDEVSYLGDQRHVMKVVPVRVPPAPEHRETAPGAIVFSGGSRGIALECALSLANSDLVTAGERPNPIVILGRSRLDDPVSLPYLSLTDEEFAQARPEIMNALHRNDPSSRPMDLQQQFRRIANNRQLWRTTQRVEHSSAPIEYLTCDVTDAAQVAQMMADVRSRHGGVRGIVHAAGLESLGQLPKKNYALAEKVVETKLQGFHNLVRTVDLDALDFLVAFTSISGRFGMDGQTEYTAGAAAVSALCSQLSHRHRSTRVVALDWTAWAEVGMATHHSVQEVQEQQRGLRYMPPEEGCRHFLRELTGGGFDPQVMIFGPLGTNEPRSALDCLIADRRAIADPISHGSIVDPGTFPMVETQVSQDSASTVFTRRLDPRLDTMLIDHLVQGSPTLPGVFHLETMAEAVRLTTGLPELMIESAKFENFVKCPEGRVCDLGITVSTEDPDHIEAAIRADVVNPSGVILVPGRQRSHAVFGPRPTVPTCPYDWADLLADRATRFDLDVYYAAAAPIITFGPSFRMLREAWRTSQGVLVGRFDISSDTRQILPEGTAQLITAPLLLDNVGRLALIDVFHRFGDHVVPVSVEHAVIRRPDPEVNEVLGCVEVRPEGPGQYAMRIHVAQLDGTPLIKVDRILLQKLNNHAVHRNLAYSTAA